jgi:hypothetical protein
MSRKVRTARGMSIDMAALAAQHENTRAVGNVPMNARGDRLNSDGTVKMKAEDIAVAHHNTATAPQQQALSDTKPIDAKRPEPPASQDIPQREQPPVQERNEPMMPDLEEQFNQEPEPISKITRTREDGTKYVEIEFDDGSIETVELKEED